MKLNILGITTGRSTGTSPVTASINESRMNNRIVSKLHDYYFDVKHELGTPQSKYISDTWGEFLLAYRLIHRHTLKRIKTKYVLIYALG